MPDLRDLPLGALIAIGHPGNGRLAVRFPDGWRDLREGAPLVDPEEFHAGWVAVGPPADPQPPRWAPERDVIHYASQPLDGPPSETACSVRMPAGRGGRLDVEWSPYRADVTCPECLDEVGSGIATSRTDTRQETGRA